MAELAQLKSQLHGAADQDGPAVLVPVAFLGAPAGLVEVVGVVVLAKVKPLPQPSPESWMESRQAAGLADHGDGAVAAGHHLGQAAGLRLREGIRKMSAPA